MKLWFIRCHSILTAVDSELMKESMAAVLCNTPDLAKYSKIKTYRILDLINLCLTSYFQLGDKYINIHEVHSQDS